VGGRNIEEGGGPSKRRACRKTPRRRKGSGTRGKMRLFQGKKSTREKAKGLLDALVARERRRGKRQTITLSVLGGLSHLQGERRLRTSPAKKKNQ